MGAIRKFDNVGTWRFYDFTEGFADIRACYSHRVVRSDIAFLLLRLIAFFTNLFFFQSISISTGASPALSSLGWLILFVPIIGGLIIGLMAKYGSERIRGHRIPEAIE